MSVESINYKLVHGGLLFIFGLDEFVELSVSFSILLIICKWTQSSWFSGLFSGFSSSNWTLESGADGIVGKNLTLRRGDVGSCDSSWNADWRTKRGLLPDIDWRLESVD